MLAIFSCTLANLFFTLYQLFEPSSFLASLLFSLAILFLYLDRVLELETISPLEVIKKFFKPKSIPIALLF